MPSNLAVQLLKEAPGRQQQPIDEERIDDVYQIITKIESKNLMLSQYLAFLIQKGFIRNSQKIQTFVDIYDQVKATNEIQSENAKGKTQDEQKFPKKKFIKAMRILASKIYPGDRQAYEKIIYPRICCLEPNEDIRVKMDETVRKILNRQTLNIWKSYEREFQILFQTYMPENFNQNMCFSWKQLKFLQKKLPIICVFRMLCECEIVPNYITPGHFIESVSKIIPPLSHINGSNPKQSLFYSAQSIINYFKESVTLKKIKLIQGDIGLSLLDFEIMLTKVAMDMSKDKNDPAKALKSFLQLINLKEVVGYKGETKGKQNKFEEHIRGYFMGEMKKTSKNNFQIQKRETKKKIEQILDFNEGMEEESKSQFRQAKITQAEFKEIKKSLDQDHLPAIYETPTVEKENDPSYKIQQKHIVIGEQLPKIPEKNKPAAPKKIDKKDQNINKFKMQEPVNEDISSDHYHQLLKKPFKKRYNEDFPIILTQAIYPNDIPNLGINPKAQIYLQTTYIHLGEKSYEKAFVNYTKARTICEGVKNQLVEFFFAMLEAQIYESAGRDSIALLAYHHSKQIAQTIHHSDGFLKCLAFRGLANCLYHLQEYQYALRCYLKMQFLKSKNWNENSVQNAMVQNNIGCCYMIMNRNNEACKHFEIAHSILDLQLGRFNERTLIAEHNLKKNRKNCIQKPPAFNTMWRTYMEKPGLKKDANPKKGSKKK